MAFYTTNLSSVLYTMTGEKYNPDSIHDMPKLILESIPEIFTFFPIFDENYRTVLCTKILSHFYFYEIGVETVPQFLFQLNRKMNEIMPYYNDLYLTQVHEYSQILDIDLRELYNVKKDIDENVQEIKNDKGDRKYDRGNASEENNVRNERSSQTTDDVKGKNYSQDENENTSLDKDIAGIKDTLDTVDLTDLTTFGKQVAHNYDSENKTTYNSTDSTTYDNNLAMTGTIGTSGSNHNTNRFSDTPQGALDGIESNKYLTTATLDDGTTSSTDTYNRNDKKTGTDSTKRTGSDTVSHTGKDTDVDSGTEKVQHTGTDTVHEDSSTSENETGKKTVKTSGEETDYGNTKTNGTNDIKETTENTSTEEYLENWTENHGMKNNLDRLENLGSQRQTYGLNSPYMDNMKKWRDSLINIDMMIIKDLAVLFMGIW